MSKIQKIQRVQKNSKQKKQTCDIKIRAPSNRFDTIRKFLHS
jgi:hypothetical protein